MTYGFLFLLDHFEGLNAYLHMVLYEFCCHLPVAFGGFDAFRGHGVVADEQKGSSRDIVGKAAGEECCCLHIDCHCSCCLETLFEFVVMFPDSAVGGKDSSGPIVVAEVADGTADGSLQHEGWQRRHFWGEVVVAGSFATNASNGQNEVAQLCLRGYASALSEKETGSWHDGAEQVHDDGCVWASHSKIDDGDAVGCGATHIGAVVWLLDSEVFAEDVNIVVEVGQQDVCAEAFERHLRISWQPILHYLLFCLHFFVILQQSYDFFQYAGTEPTENRIKSHLKRWQAAGFRCPEAQVCGAHARRMGAPAVRPFPY